MKKNLFIIIIALVILAVGVSIAFWGSRTGRKVAIQGTPRVIEETPVIPDTQEVSMADARILEQGAVSVPLVPKTEGERVIVPRAKLTMKGVCDRALPETAKWSPDAKLVFIKSLGAITLEGKSSQWQLVFSSKTKKGRGYEVIVQEDRIVSQKEITSTAVGADMPKEWYDSDGAIKSLQSLPQFLDATIWAINFFYDRDSEWWMYVIATSVGNTSMFVK